MSIKTNSKLLLTVFLAGSLSGYVNASQDDLIEEQAELLEEGSRLQITGAYNLLSAQIDAFQAAVPSSIQSAANRVADLASNAVIAVRPVNGDTTDDDYVTALNIVSPLITTALTTPNYTNILAVQTSINTATTGLLARATSLTATTSGATQPAILAAVNQLNAAVTSWLAFYPA